MAPGHRYHTFAGMALAVCLCFVAGAAAAAPDRLPEQAGTVRLTIDGLSASVGEDDPRVLTILPWQPPTLPRRPRADLDDSAQDLLQPVSPDSLERHRLFRQSLNPLTPGPSGAPGLTAQ